MYRYPKQILTIEQQIQSYIDAGMEIESYDQVEDSMGNCRGSLIWNNV